ncbi:hypothetical protein Tco_0924147 [Tanacetum coccineum]|uniref:Uncharacterized protein n=1 Tax=Tanacetum coccineum TaxID=301880 RepID=A0ABQ5D420_9ASTR
MSSASSAVTYTSVYTDSEPSRAFWGADDEEVSEGGIPSGLEDPQTPLVPQDEDEHEPMFIQAHDPDYVPEPIYPEYIPLEDEHEFPAEEQPLPPVDSPTAESPGYVTESDPEEDPEEYEDDKTEDGPVDYPMDGGDDGDDDNGDSSRDDANDEDADEEEEERSPQTSISLPPEAEVERLLAMTTPSPSPPISLSPPSVGERLARYEIEESSTARPTRGRGIDYEFVSTVRYEGGWTWGLEIVWVNTRVPELAELHEHDTQDLYTLLEDAHDRDSMDGVKRRPMHLERLGAHSIGF